MGNLNKELENVKNPLLGSFCIWNFVKGYEKESKQKTPLHLVFLVLPIVYSEELVSVIESTQVDSGLRKCLDKLQISKNARRDEILKIHKACIEMRELSLDSLRIALYSSLIRLDYENAELYSNAKTNKKSEPKDILKLSRAAEKLGIWFSRLTLYEITLLLKVRF